MANFNKNKWISMTELEPWSHICWNCGNLVSSVYGYTNNAQSWIYICPHCNAPHIKDIYGYTYPFAVYGKVFQKLPLEIQKCYDEARLALSAGAYTAAVMMFRKILMSLAVNEGAKEGDSFSNYVTYLCNNGFVHKKHHQQAENLKKLGNDANHKIESRTETEAKEMLKFVERLLLNNYECADEESETK